MGRVLKFLRAPARGFSYVSNLGKGMPGQFGTHCGQPPHGEHLRATARLLTEITKAIAWPPAATFLDLTIYRHRQQLADSEARDHQNGYGCNPQPVSGFRRQLAINISQTQQSCFGRQTIAALLLACNRVAGEILDPLRLRSVVEGTADSTRGHALRARP